MTQNGARTQNPKMIFTKFFLEKKKSKNSFGKGKSFEKDLARNKRFLYK